MPLAGGVLQHGYQCGMIWGAVLAAGRQTYRRCDSHSQTEACAVLIAQRLVESFLDLNGHMNCAELTDLDKSSSAMKMITYFLFKGGVISCLRKAAAFSPVAFDRIEAGLMVQGNELLYRPASCASILARKMGASDVHAAMVAGMAGGIGLCGGGCGALGAALWLVSLNKCRRGGKIEFNDPELAHVMDEFLKSSGYRFTCSEIVGRKFSGLEDHSAYLQSGGCADIIETLAAVGMTDQ